MTHSRTHLLTHTFTLLASHTSFFTLTHTEKRLIMSDIEDNWESPTDYILSTVFVKPTSVSPTTHKLKSDITDITGQVKFERNEFPYQLDKGAYHYVLWMGPCASTSASDLSHSAVLPTEDEINDHISRALEQITGGIDFDFAWYENPKMTIPSVFHVQVFWCVY